MLLAHLRRSSRCCIVPCALAMITSPNTLSVLKAAPGNELLYCYLCGAAWGFGGLTWGLMIRYLGVGLGLALGCGICSAAGTLVPPKIRRVSNQEGTTFSQLLQSNAGHRSFVGVVVSLVGIVLVGMAGMSKEKELPEEEKKKAVAEYNFKKGMLVGAVLRLDERRPRLRPGRRADDSKAGGDHGAGHLPDLERHASAGGRAARRIHRQLPLVPLPQREEQDHRAITPRAATPLIGNFIFARHRRRHLGLASSSAFKTGEPAMGSDSLRRLGIADGLPDSVQLPDRRGSSANGRAPAAGPSRCWPAAWRC